MSKLVEFMERLLYAIFPFIQSYFANKKIEKRLKCQVEHDNNQSLESLRDEYERSLKGKDILEDKAKVNIVAITISITLIMGAASIVKDLMEDPLWLWIPFVAAFLFIWAVIYMFIAGTSAFKLLMDKNIIFYAAKNSEDIQEYITNLEGNNNFNLIRNNLINASFKCIRNALICLLVVLTLTLFNQLNFRNLYKGTDSNHLKNNTEIFYSDTVIKNDNFSELHKYVEPLIIEYNESNKLKKGEYLGLVDQYNNIFVKVIMQSEGIIRVVSIERFIP